MIIDVKGAIVGNNQKWIYEWLEMDATSPKDVISALRDTKDNEEIEVNISSGGGNAYAGMEIYTALKDYKGKVTCRVVGVAASAASIIAMAGDTVKMTPVGQIMIHKASVMVQGNHNQMDHVSAVLQSHDKGIASAYVNKTGMSEAEILELMNSETYFDAKKALEMNFIDEILFDDNLKVSASIGHEIPEFLIDKVKNVLMKNEILPENKMRFSDTQLDIKPKSVIYGPTTMTDDDIEKFMNDWKKANKKDVENGEADPQPTSNIALTEQQDNFRKLKLKIMGGITQ